MSSPLSDRIAAAPISWGVCEVPGWGHQLDPATVLGEMTELGVAATEFGPDGFLPEAPQDKANTLREYGLQAVGQFVPVVLHDPAQDPLPEVDAAMEGLVAAGASTLVLAAATGLKKAGHSTRWILGLWVLVALVSGLASGLGYALLGGASDNLVGGIQAFAAGAILTMLANTMFPEAVEDTGKAVGLVTVLGFALAFLLSRL